MLPKDPAAFNELLLLNRALLINIFESKPSEYRFEAQRKLYQQLQDIYNQLVDNDFKKDVAEMLTLKGSDQLLASVAPASGIRIELHSLSERIGQLRSKINTHSRYKRVSLANCHKDGDATTEKSNGANISLVESMMETFLETKADGTTSSNMTDSELGDLMIKFEEDYDDDLLPMASSADNNNTEASSRPTCAVNSHSSPVAPPAKAKRPASSMIPSARSQKQAKVDAMSKETTLQPNVNSNRKMVNRQSPVRYIYTSNDNGLARSMLESQPSSSAAAAASTFSGNYVPIAPKPVVGTSSTSTGTSNSLPSYPNPTITNVPISNPIPVPVKLPPNKKLKVIMVGSKPAGVILNGRPMLAMVDTVGNILCAPTKVTTGMTFVSMTDLPKLVKSTNPPNIAKAITQPPVKQVVANISQPSKPSTSKQGLCILFVFQMSLTLSPLSKDHHRRHQSQPTTKARWRQRKVSVCVW